MVSVPSVAGLRPTRRGLAVVVVALAAFALGATSGARSLNAVVVPALVALVAAGVQLSRADDPAVSRADPESGFPGDTHRVRIEVDSEVPCTVVDDLDRGVTVSGNPTDTPSGTVGHGGTFSYPLVYKRRGDHRLGPVTCRLTDSLGLFATDYESDAVATALVYPQVYELEGTRLDDLVGRVLGGERSEFDRLREFTPGDTMRDIHWRASAKREESEFVVTEYERQAETEHVDIVGEAAFGNTNGMASTVASIAAHLHDNDITVVATVPEGECVARPGETADLLELLARTRDGTVDSEARATADIYVRGEDGTVTVSLEDHDYDFEGMAGDERRMEVAA